MTWQAVKNTLWRGLCMASYGWGSRVVLATNWAFLATHRLPLCMGELRTLPTSLLGNHDVDTHTQPATSLTLQRPQIQLGQHPFDRTQAQTRLESLSPQHTHNNPPPQKINTISLPCHTKFLASGSSTPHSTSDNNLKPPPDEWTGKDRRKEERTPRPASQPQHGLQV